MPDVAVPTMGCRVPRGRGWVVRAVGLVSVFVLVWSGVGAAQADPVVQPDGNWWYGALGVPQAQAEGITGAGVPVAVVERLVDPDLPVLVDAHLTVREPSFCAGPDGGAVPATSDMGSQGVYVGTNAVAIIAGNGSGALGDVSMSGVAPGADVRFYSIADRCITYGYADAARALVQAVDDGARIVAMPYMRVDADREVSQAVAYALHEKVVIVVPACGSEAVPWMANLNGVVTVCAAYAGGGLWPAPFGKVTVSAPGYPLRVERVEFGTTDWYTGDSQSLPELSAPLVAGMLADVAQRWPAATNDQLIQTLIRNTGPDDHDLVYDDVAGYGPADLLHMLRTDPTGYPDENPLIVPDDGQQYGLTAEAIRAAELPEWAVAQPTQTPISPSPAVRDTSPRRSWAVGIGVAAVLLVGATAAVVTFRRRNRVSSVETAVPTPPETGSSADNVQEKRRQESG